MSDGSGVWEGLLLRHGNGLREGCWIRGAAAYMEGDALDGHIVLPGCRIQSFTVLKLCTVLVAKLTPADSI